MSMHFFHVLFFDFENATDVSFIDYWVERVHVSSRQVIGTGLHKLYFFVHEISYTQTRFRYTSVHVEIVQVKEQTCTLLIIK